MSPGPLAVLLLFPLVQGQVVNDGFGRPPREKENKQPTQKWEQPVILEAVGPDQNDVQVSTTNNQNQNETVIRVDPTDRDHLIGGANDDRGVDYTCAFYASQDGGNSWSELLYPVVLPFDAAGDPAAAFGPGGEVYFCGLAFDRGQQFSSLVVGQSFDGGVTVPAWVEAVASPPGAFEDKQYLTADQGAGALAGALYLTWTRFSAGFSQSPIMCTTSFNNGATWTTPRQVSDTLSNQGSVPAVGPGGELYVAWLDNGTTVKVDKSVDGGLTFGTDVIVANAVNCTLPGAVYRFNCFPSLDVDTSGGPFNGRVYVAWMSDINGDPDIFVSRSQNGGVTWSPRVQVTDDVGIKGQVFPWLDVDANGNVNVGFFDRRDDPADRNLGFWVARSSDGGATYQPNVRVSNTTFNPSTYGDGFFMGDYNGLAASDRTVHPLWTDGRNATNDIFTSRVQLDFYGDKDTLSAATGGAVNFNINVGPVYRNDPYLVLGSITGTSPGITLGNGENIQVNFDVYTRITLLFANSAILPGFSGTLDTTGSAACSVDFGPGPLDPAFIGLVFDHAVVVNHGGLLTWASNFAEFTVVP